MRDKTRSQLVLGTLLAGLQAASPAATPAPPTAPPASAATAVQEPSRGKLLYDNHCIACHSAALHWRQGKLATDWASLKEQVRVWQARGQLNWTEADIVEVTRYLDESIYRFARSPLSELRRRVRPGANRCG